MAKIDPQVLAHLEWMGYVQPTGLVVSAPAMVRAGAILDRSDAEGQRLLRACIEERQFRAGEDPEPWLPDFETFARHVLSWNFSPKGYAGTPDSPVPEELRVTLADYGETLQPDYAVRDYGSKEGEPPWQLLVRVLEPGQDLDAVIRGPGGLEASPHSRLERLLRRTEIKAGLLFNGRTLRLLSAPRGESSGWMDFHVGMMVQTAGRPICSALRLLVGQTRLLSVSTEKRLAALLEDSRKYQNEVSERLAEQVLHALYELLRGLQAAHDGSSRELLREVLAEHPDQVYRALLTVLLRLVFLLYAEERDMLPKDEAFLRYYSVAGLYERLREDAALFPDTMDQRFGAWAQLLVLFRLVHDGAESGGMSLPQRHGVLFDPDRFKFLEGRLSGGARQAHERIEAPLVPDGTVHRALEKLLVLDGERISYRALDVEQIGSVYETMMGFRLETASGPSVAVKAQKRFGAPTTFDLEALLDEAPSRRAKAFQNSADRKVTDTVRKAMVGAATLDDLHAALHPVIDRQATPDLVPQGAMVLQPSEERRRSGSHYTPRVLTEPIVRTTLEPILSSLCVDGKAPQPAQVLDLKVLDPAMGSGAFLVEVCRQLGDVLVEAWQAHGEMPEIPADEDETILARRLVAQRCLYGVDRNPVAVDLAKVSLWLATLAKDHPFTFVDHALRHGDSLVGLSQKQIEAFHWDPGALRFQVGFETMRVSQHLARALDLRRQIRDAGEDATNQELRHLWEEVEGELAQLRLFGDLVLSAFFDGTGPTERERNREDYATAVGYGRAEEHRWRLEEQRSAERSHVPFHWEIELPEVFGREKPGFDAVVGNPPFLGGKRLSTAYGDAYSDYLVTAWPFTSKNVDLCGRFHARASQVVRVGGRYGLISTENVLAGDSKSRCIDYLESHIGEFTQIDRGITWPGDAAVEVCMLFFEKNGGKQSIASEVKEPVRLLDNKGLSYVGCAVQGMGFILGEDAAIPEEERQGVVRPFLVADDLNNHPLSRPAREIVFFRGMDLTQASQFPRAMSYVRDRVKPYRDTVKRKAHRERWWQYGDWRPGLYAALQGSTHSIVVGMTAKYFAFRLLPSDYVFDQTTVAFPSDSWSLFAILMATLHSSVWAREYGAKMGKSPRYNPTRCLETFPLPTNWGRNRALKAAGESYHQFRDELMVHNDEGLTKTYNRFHDPDEYDPGILELRELHAAMDRAVLDAYGWDDIPTDCDFLLDYEIDEKKYARRRKPWRYRFPDDVRDEVLARLLELNAERAAEEARSGPNASKRRALKSPARRTRGASQSGDLFS
jgi:hypothetical protein